MKCHVENCYGKVVSKGLCDKHRIRLRRHGNVNSTLKYHFDTVEEYFFSKVKITKTNSCIFWPARKLESGYGMISAKGKKRLSHRLSYEIHFGKIPKGMVICHRCDQPSCVNPRHLFIGTHKDNVYDCINKKRNVTPPIHTGKNNHHTKLTETKVIEIRKSYASGKINSYELAKKYNVTRQNIMSIVKLETWKNVK
jgi:hypothetical protein